MSIKVAYLLGSLNRGGTETLLLDVFRNASKNNHDAVGIYRKTGVYENAFLSSGVPMHKLPVGRNPISYLLKLRRLLKTNYITVAHAQQPIDALYARMACIGTGIKVVLTFHGYDYTENRFALLVMKSIIGCTDWNIYVSDTQREYYQDKYILKPNKQTVVYNGISFDKLDNPDTRSATLSRAPGIRVENLRVELQLSSDTLLMGSVGNFVQGRDQFTICRFLKLLNEQGVDFHFVFVGKCSEQMPQLYDTCFEFCQQNELSGKVSFLGSRDDVPQILHQLDAFVYSTDHDTFGIAVVEAMAIGIPVFVNDWGVMSEITDGGKQATLYKTKNEEDLLREFMLFLKNKEVYLNKAKQAATFVRKKYSIEKHIEKLKIVYSDIVNSL